MAFRISARKKDVHHGAGPGVFHHSKIILAVQAQGQEAMKSGGTHQPHRKAEVDELLIRRRGEGVPGRREKRKVVMSAEKNKGNKIGQAYGKVIKVARRGNLKPFPHVQIHQDHGRMFTNGFEGQRWRGRDFKFSQRPSGHRKRFSGMHIVVMNLNGWLRGIHHHCSIRFAGGYLDEFIFRFNRRNSLSSISHQFMVGFMMNPPYRYIAHAA